MILNRSYRIVAVLLSLLMFFSSTGISMNLHYCQGQLRSISLLTKSKCCTAEKTMSCHERISHTDSDDICAVDKEDKKCCQNEKLKVESLDQDFLTVSSTLTELSSPQIHFFVAEMVALVAIDDAKLLISNFEHYKPPLPKKDIQVLFQTFII